MKNTSLEPGSREKSAYHADTGISRVVLADNDVRFAGVLKQHLERDRFAITLGINDGGLPCNALSGNTTSRLKRRWPEWTIPRARDQERSQMPVCGSRPATMIANRISASAVGGRRVENAHGERASVPKPAPIQLQQIPIRQRPPGKPTPALRHPALAGQV